MVVTVCDRVDPVDRVELTHWFDRARLPWSPLMVAGRQFDALICDSEDVPGLVAYDRLYDVANLAVQWLGDNLCPDIAVGRGFKAQMMAYRAVADAVRSTITQEDGDVMVAQLVELRDVIDQHTAAIDQAEP
jgi:hypothetical protein